MMLTPKQEKIIDYLYVNNGATFNVCKTIEELQELSLALTQKLTKPSIDNTQAVIDEIGDVMLRLEILKKMFPKDKIKERIDLKLSKWETYIDHKRFKNI